MTTLLTILSFAIWPALLAFVIWRVVRRPKPPDPFLYDMRRERSSRRKSWN